MTELFPLYLAQKEKGRVASAIAALALNGARLDDLLDDENREIWREMHPVAHLWLACIDVVMPADSAELCRRLLMAERFLDRMQAREDLRHPEPWRLRPEVRAHLERLYGDGS